MAAAYVAPIWGPYEAWELATDRIGFSARLSQEYQFAVRYRVAGQEFWDNNLSNDYFAAVGPRQVWGGPEFLLGAGEVALERARRASAIDDTDTFLGEVVVRNLGYEKEITLVYSTDGWDTVQEASAEFGEAWFGDSERWTVQIFGLDADEPFEFAVRYEVAGQVFWDDNFRRNYTQ